MERTSERLQKVIARAGVASRRKAEQLITAGHVRVNGRKVTELGTKIDPDRDKVVVNGQEVYSEANRYYMFYKPVGVITSAHDPHGRRVVTDFFQEIPERLYPVGRLDYYTEGLLLMTNDGDLAHRLMHPRFELEKSYVVKVEGIPDEHVLQQLRRGISLEDGMTAPAQASFLKVLAENAWIRLTIHEGRNRQIRRMCQAVGHPVQKLKRDRVGFLSLGRLQPGQYRSLTADEVDKLRRLLT